MTSISRLSSGAPGATTAPLSPPARTPGGVHQHQSAEDALGIGAVALVAPLGEHRANFRLEVIEVLRRNLLRSRRPGDAGGQKQEEAR